MDEQLASIRSNLETTESLVKEKDDELKVSETVSVLTMRTESYPDIHFFVNSITFPLIMCNKFTCSKFSLAGQILNLAGKCLMRGHVYCVLRVKLV